MGFDSAILYPFNSKEKTVKPDDILLMLTICDLLGKSKNAKDVRDAYQGAIRELACISHRRISDCVAGI